MVCTFNPNDLSRFVSSAVRDLSVIQSSTSFDSAKRTMPGALPLAAESFVSL